MCKCGSCGKVLNAAAVGPQGPTGNTGATGPQGDPGATGPAGPSGTALMPVIVATINTALVPSNTGYLIVIDKPDIITIFLPGAPTNGTVYSFQIKRDTVGICTISCGGGDVFGGNLMAVSAAPTVVFNTTGVQTGISFNGSTTGGLIGTYFQIVYYSGIWYTSGTNICTGAPVTPFI